MRRAAVERDLGGMAALGFTVVRWFLFADGRAGIVFDDRGLPSRPDPHLFPDLDAALELARDLDLRIQFVLLDHRWMFEGLREMIPDPITGTLFEATLPDGRSRVLLTSAGRDALFDRVIVPLVMRYASSGERADLAEQIFAFELMNEPDFVIEEWEIDLSPHVSRPLPFDVMADLVSRLSALVHGRSPALATIGAARLHNLWAWDDDSLGLDLLQLHSYPDTRHPDREPDLFGKHAASLDVRRPVLLAEFPGNAPERHPEGASPPPTTLEQYLEFALRGGYAGAWPWSFSGTDAYGRLPMEPLRRFAAAHPELVNRAARREPEK